MLLVWVCTAHTSGYQQSIENPGRPIGVSFSQVYGWSGLSLLTQAEHYDAPRKRSKAMFGAADEAGLSRSHLPLHPAPLSCPGSSNPLRGMEDAPGATVILDADHGGHSSALDHIDSTAGGLGTACMRSNWSPPSPVPILSIPPVCTRHHVLLKPTQ